MKAVRYQRLKAAELRQISVGDYVRQVTVSQARKEVLAATEQTIALTPDEQLAFWTALNQPVKLTQAHVRRQREGFLPALRLYRIAGPSVSPVSQFPPTRSDDEDQLSNDDVALQQLSRPSLVPFDLRAVTKRKSRSSRPVILSIGQDC